MPIVSLGQKLRQDEHVVLPSEWPAPSLHILDAPHQNLHFPGPRLKMPGDAMPLPSQRLQTWQGPPWAPFLSNMSLYMRLIDFHYYETDSILGIHMKRMTQVRKYDMDVLRLRFLNPEKRFVVPFKMEA